MLVGLHPGQKLGDHQVKEHAWLIVVHGSVTLRAGDEEIEAPAGTLARFEPDERHSVSTEAGAKILLLLAPWPAGPLPRRREGEGARLARLARGALLLVPAQQHAVDEQVDHVAERHEEGEEQSDVEDQPRGRQAVGREQDEHGDQRAEDGRALEDSLEGRLLDRPPAPVDEAGRLLLRLPVRRALRLRGAPGPR